MNLKENKMIVRERIGKGFLNNLRRGLICGLQSYHASLIMAFLVEDVLA